MLKSNLSINTLNYTVDTGFPAQRATVPQDATSPLLPRADNHFNSWLKENCLCIGVSIFAGFIIGIVVSVLIHFY
jgi:hypothetical protein